jgi:hypothetical protein
MDASTIEVLARARATATDADLRDVVWAMAVPALVADHTPLLSRYEGCTVDQVGERLMDIVELLAALDAIGVRAWSAPWVQLCGVGGDDVPGLGERLDSPIEYPHLKTHLIEQLSAPWSGTTALVHEHAVRTSGRDRVIVQSQDFWIGRDRRGPGVCGPQACPRQDDHHGLIGEDWSASYRLDVKRDEAPGQSRRPMLAR